MCITSHPASVRPLSASLLVSIVTLVETQDVEGDECAEQQARMPISAEGTEEDLELPSTPQPREIVSQAPQHTQEKAAETRERLG
ncbi:unnamed protein product [Rangifer tarandus platyrhynchus]|uniref:Uncharacterized protein n=1 Tax=Rangifer tarandus platyrhynchus TaxID=3082113 RepID=A0AC59ZYN0_RANTA